MIYAGYDFKDDLIVETVKRTLMPPVKNSFFNLANGKSKLMKSVLGSTEIEVEIRLIRNTERELTELKRRLAPFLYKGLARLELDDEPSRYDMAVIDGTIDLERFFYTGKSKLTFINPTGESISKEVKTSTGTNITIVNNGTTDTYLTTKTTFSSSTPSYTLKNGSKTMIITYPFISGDVLTIDFEKQTVLKNIQDINAYVDFESDFFTLKTGSNTLTASLNTEFKYSERWI